MELQTSVILTIGIIFFLGLTADMLGRHTPIPRVTFLILIGLAVGPDGLDLLPHLFMTQWFPAITTVALGMIGFLLGQQFTLPALKASGSVVFAIALGKVLVSFFLLWLVLWSVGLPFAVALLLASIASATAPAAIYEVIHERNIDNRFVRTLLAVVALDDILAMLLFSLALAFLDSSVGGGTVSALVGGIIEILGSLLLGYAAGYPVAKLTGRLNPGEPTLVEALGSVFLISGLAVWLDLSAILAAMAMGSAVTTFATHHTRPFHAIENIQWLFLILFFLFAGASLEVEAIAGIGLFGVVYIVVRIMGFYVGARLGARWSGADSVTQTWIGFALIPQAGVTIGMALIASQRFGEYAHLILPIVLGTTVVFEIFGPMVTRYSLKRAGEAYPLMPRDDTES